MSTALQDAIREIQEICAGTDSKSQCFLSGSTGYNDSQGHFLYSSSAPSALAVQLGNANDLSNIMKVLANRKIEFAIKGGGHATNPSFSSTSSQGILLYTTRLDSIDYNPNKETLDVGAGCLWDQVYATAREKGRNVVGGSDDQGVGIGGYLLGGGYSRTTNQFGLGADNITAYQVVLPDGRIVDAEDGTGFQDLFYALMGGRNNFGIVTRFTIKTYPFEGTYNRHFLFGCNHVPKFKAAVMKFIANEERPQAAFEAKFKHTRYNDEPQQYMIDVECFWDGKRPSDDPWKYFREVGPPCPGPDTGIEDEILEIDPDELKISSHHPFYVKPVGCVPDMPINDRILGAGTGDIDADGRWSCIMVSGYTSKIVDAIVKAAEDSAARMKDHYGIMVSIGVWPFLPDIFDKSPSKAAWPHRGKAFYPVVAEYMWAKNTGSSGFWIKEIKDALATIYAVALEEGCTSPDLPIYSNTTLADTPLTDIYHDNLQVLSQIRQIYDPDNVMGRSGGFIIPLPGGTGL
jgi:hypothetical protein